jgi:DNA replicative helicase MCM subunit Mcm2 (Cdc46/Mcm family)
MTKEAADVLQQFYLQLRKQSSADGSPITARQLESLVRLVEARARLELREEITKQDALVNLLPPLEIMSKCFTSSFPVSPKNT